MRVACNACNPRYLIVGARPPLAFSVLEDVVAQFYTSVARAFPKRLYELALKAAGAKLPSELVFGVFDKGTEVPNFICVNGWREIHRRIFLDTHRYKELLRCADARDARFLLLWRLADTLSLSFFGKYCAFSIQHALSLLPDAAATQCACMHGRYRPSASCKSLYAPLLATACSKLKKIGTGFLGVRPYYCAPPA